MEAEANRREAEAAASVQAANAHSEDLAFARARSDEAATAAASLAAEEATRRADAAVRVQSAPYRLSVHLTGRRVDVAPTQLSWTPPPPASSSMK